MTRSPWVPALIAGLLIVLALPADAADKDDDDDDAAGATLELTTAQRTAVGIAIAQPVAASPKPHIAAFGQVLDGAALIGDFAALDADRSADRAAVSELERLRALHAGGAGASLKAVQAGESEQSRTHAALEASSTRLGLHWTPLAALPAGDRQALFQKLRSGDNALIRADVTGRQSLAGIPSNATVTIDGAARPVLVLGALRAAGTGAASPALLLELRDAPAGLSPGIRVAVTLDGEATPGFAVPGSALLFDEKGAHVYQELASAANATKTTYARRNVQVVMPIGDGWLVHGVDEDDRIVVRGVGLLWSMQGGTTDDVD
jgi:hypothetical protein